MDNYIIGLLPTVAPEDNMKIAVSGGIHAITIADLKAYINSGNGGNSGNSTLQYTFTKSDGTVYTNEAPSMTNAELNSGFTVKITDSFTSPITWATSGEGISGSYGNSGYSAFFQLESGFDYIAGTNLLFTASIDGVQKVTITVKVGG